MNWEIKDFKEYRSGTLRGFFTLAAGILEISGCKYFEGDKGPWVALPTEAFEDKEGNKKYKSIVSIPDKQRYSDFQAWATTELSKIVGVEPEPEKGSEEDSSIPF